MYNSDNVYYFPGNIDVRVCPKNGNSSVKQFYINIIRTCYPDRDLKTEFNFYANLNKNPKTKKDMMTWRQRQVLDYGDQFDLPFRKNSIRITIKRNPIERFKSAVEMLQLDAKWNKIPIESSIDGIKKEYRYFNSVSDLLNDIENNNVVNIHFWTQSYFLEDKNRYDHIYDLEDFVEFQRHVLFMNNIKWSDRWYIHQNISNNSDEKRIKELREKTQSKFIMASRPGIGPDQSYFDFEKKESLITRKMNADDYKRIKRLYKIDYDNGWC